MRLRDNIYSIGVIDKDIRMFHGYETPHGTTYNSFLIIDEMVTMVDFVKRPFAAEFIERIKAVLGGRGIDNIICNHIEPDHSGALPEIMKLYPEAVIYGTAKCKSGLSVYYPNSDYNFVTVKQGEHLKTGRYTFDFLPAPMVHWPDSMITYLREERILFSNDALGQHIGTGECFDHELGLNRLLDRAGDYYANIVLPFGLQVEKLLEATGKLTIEMICPAHGVILRDFIPQTLEKYSCWSKNETDENKLVIIYDTMWGTTEKLARRLYEEYAARDFEAELISLSEKHYSYALAQLLEAKYIFVGSPTLNNQVMPTVSAFLTYMRGLKPRGRIGRAFGSYGWSGESVTIINDILSAGGFEMLDPLKIQWNV